MIKEEEPDFEPLDEFSPEIKGLIKMCLNKDPKQRPTADQLLKTSNLLREGFMSVAGDQNKIMIADSFKRVGQRTLFQKSICCFVANILSSTNQMKEVHRVFREINKSHSGQISREEFHQGRACLGPLISNLDQSNTDEIFNNLDENGDGQISY